VNIGFDLVRDVEVDYPCHRFHIESPGRDIGSDQRFDLLVLEAFQHLEPAVLVMISV
jgi:hypothetical protein